MILTDNGIRVDLLNNEAIATTIIALLREQPARPVTIGVHGDWGAGKSSILEMIEVGLDDKDDTLCLKFNGWRFQGFEDAKIALIEGIVTGLIAKSARFDQNGRGRQRHLRPHRLAQGGPQRRRTRIHGFHRDSNAGSDPRDSRRP